MLWDKTLAISICLDEEMGPQTFPNYVMGWNSRWRNGSTNFSKWCCGIKIWQFPHVWMKKWVHRHLQMMLWGETLAISTYLNEEMGPQISPNDDVGWISGHFHISGSRNGSTHISKWCCGMKLGHFHMSGWRNGSTNISKWFCGVKLWPFPHVWMKK